ncbi:lipocalin family protein [Capnocytophaga sputigena]|uniref:lipocalin family protein n=1 Tax=Capnocytophaga sputigena TaxID=1019 RepID=UPI0028D6789F|nr:lipocalin family protein [Capnocytophaga sputigena]
MKKLIFSALVATALFVSSCGKDDDNGGGSTSLTGDWYLHTVYNDLDGYGLRWIAPDNCAQKTYFSISDKKIKYERYHLEGSECKYTPQYYNYTTNNGVINATVADDSPNGNKGGTASMKYEIKDKELIFRFKNNRQQEEINVLHKKGEDYSYLDPFIGYWRMTKYVVGQQEFIVQDGKCLYGSIVANPLGATLYLNYPENGQCNKTINTYKWVKEGGKYYNVSNPAEKTLWDINFSNNNRYMTFAIDNGRTVMHFTKEK